MDKPQRAGKLGLAVTVAVALLAAAALIWVPRYQINQDLAQDRLQPEDVPEQVDRYRRTWAQIFGGMAVLLGLYFTHRRLLSTERNVESAREGQITERFTRAIEQLGDERLTMRLGGIYALERIARDSERDHWAVMEILTAFVRGSTPYLKKIELEDVSPDEEQEEWVETKTEKVTPDVQAALTVIGRRHTAYDPEGHALNLDGTRVPGIELYEADFNGALLHEADFNGATFHRVDFRKALLIDTDFSGAFLGKVDFRKAILYDADFSGAKLLGADFGGADYALRQLAAARSVKGIKGLSDEELAELERLREASDEDDQQSREEEDGQ